MALAPFLDLLNHSCTARVQTFYDPVLQSFTIKTLLPVQPGEQVFILYGPHDNAFLLCEYGFVLPDNLATYYTIIRPCSAELIQYSRDLVGKDNVYILTASTHDYANEVNRLADWGFDTDHILTREVIAEHRYATAYGSSTAVPHKLSDPNNVLIDNLPSRYNENKMILIGIKSDRYLQIRDYYGVDYSDESFQEDVMEFLTAKNKL